MLEQVRRVRHLVWQPGHPQGHRRQRLDRRRRPKSVDIVVKLGMMARAIGVDPVRLEASIKKRLKAAFEGEAA
jgi:hypothetical protein